jgi:NitT/TauT family transport system substrate-binding protein
MKKLLSLFLALSLSLGLLAGCAGTGSGAPAESKTPEPTAAPSAQPVQLTIAFCTWVGYAPLYIAKEKGYFEKYGIDPTLTIIEDESQYATAMFSNSIQGLGNVLDREVIHFSKGTPETVILAMDQSSGGDGVIASADIKTVGDLKGMTVGLDKSSTSYFFFLTILAQNGMSEDDVSISDMGADDAGAAFLAGSLDAAVTWEPYLSEAGTRQGGHILATSADYPNTIVDVLAVRSDFASQNPQAVNGLAAAWYDAIDYYKANPDEGNKIMAEGLGLEQDEVAGEAEGITFYGRDENSKFFDKASEAGIYSVAGAAVDFWKEKKIIDTDVDLDSLISDTYYKASVN